MVIKQLALFNPSKTILIYIVRAKFLWEQIINNIILRNNCKLVLLNSTWYIIY